MPGELETKAYGDTEITSKDRRLNSRMKGAGEVKLDKVDFLGSMDAVRNFLERRKFSGQWIRKRQGDRGEKEMSSSSSHTSSVVRFWNIIR